MNRPLVRGLTLDSHRILRQGPDQGLKVWDVVSSWFTNGHLWRCDEVDGIELPDRSKGWSPVAAELRGGCVLTTPNPYDPYRWDGLVEMILNNHRINAVNLPRSDISRSGDRCLMLAFNNRGNLNNGRFWFSGIELLNFDAHNIGFIFGGSLAGAAIQFYDPTIIFIGNLDNTHSHTDGGSSEPLNNDDPGIMIVCIYYDATAEAYNIFWKSTSHQRQGFSKLGPVASALPTGPTTGLEDFLIHGFGSGFSFLGDFLGCAYFEGYPTETQFATLLDFARMNGTL